MTLPGLLSIFLVLPLYQAQGQDLHPLFEVRQPSDMSADFKLTLKRGHAKGVCARAELEILPLKNRLPERIATRLSAGLFSRPGRYASLLRFSNASPAGPQGPPADQVPDLHGLAMAVMTGETAPIPSARFDFMFLDSPRSVVNSASELATLLFYQKHGLLQTALQWGWRSTLTARGAEELENQLKQSAQASITRGYQNQSYYTALAFRLGQFEAVKYAMIPCEWNPNENLSTHPDALKRELSRHVTRDSLMSCFDFRVQLLEVEQMRDPRGRLRRSFDWVENASWLWPESSAPFYTLGRLSLRSQSLLQERDCDQFEFDIYQNSSPEHRGLGSIHRALGNARSTGLDSQ